MQETFFTSKEAAQITGCTLRQIQYWREKGIVVPEQFQTLSLDLKNANLIAQVFFWDDFHDRYLITNIIGINLNNGFNTDKTWTTWTKLSKSDRNHINDEFKLDSVGKKSLVGNHLLKYKFSLPF